MPCKTVLANEQTAKIAKPITNNYGNSQLLKASNEYLMSANLSDYDTILTSHYPSKLQSKRKKVLKLIKEIGGKDLSSKDAGLTMETKAFQEKYYKLTIKNFEYYYFGSLKNSMPHGDGVIVDGAGYVVYAGSFKEGRYNGYGILFSDGIIVEEGEYKAGLLHGEGIRYYGTEYNSDSSPMNAYSEISETLSDKVDIFLPVPTPSVKCEGTFAKGKADGKNYKTYYSKYITSSTLRQTTDVNYGQIYYDGATKSGEREGKGKSYYPDGTLNYNGEWRNGKYNGKGTLYNEDGTVKHKGEFKAGDVK